MRLLFRSMFRHLKGHLPQTCLTMAVAVLITGMLAVLFYFASSFQSSLRAYALEKYGTYHYKYYTNAGTGVAELFAEMEERFQEDGWFSEVELTEENNQVYMILTVAHPGLFTSKTMERKFDAMVECCYERAEGEVFFLGIDHNYELLASYGDLSKENGIYSFLFVFLILLAAVAAAAILTLGAVFQVSAMQREREIALLSGIGADRRQIVSMILMESSIYCLVSLPAGFALGICVYRGIQEYIDSILYSLFQFPPADLVVSMAYSTVMAGCAVCVILLSGLWSAVRVSRISPVEALRHTSEIRHSDSSRKNVSDNKMAVRAENWLARKSCHRFRRRNRPMLIMLAVTFTLCFVLDGFKRYATEVVRMTFDTISYNFSIDLYSDEKEKVDMLASVLKEQLDDQLAEVREAVFSLRDPYPFSESGQLSLMTNGSMMPDVVLQCIDEESFEIICEELGISGETEGMWGIFLDTERYWWANGVKVRGCPYAVTAGEQIRFYASPDVKEGEEEYVLTIAEVYDMYPPYTEISASTRMQILVPYTVFSMLEEKRPYMELEPGIYHISLRGDIGNGKAFRKIAEEQAEKFPEVTYRISDFEEQIRQEQSSINSFEFLCEALIAIFVFICICGNITISWAVNKAREREFAVLLSIGMRQGDLQKMRLLELLYNAGNAFLPGMLAGMCVYQMIYLIYTSEYQIEWRFPLTGLLLGIGALVVSMGITDLVLRFGSGKRSLSEQLRMEE